MDDGIQDRVALVAASSKGLGKACDIQEAQHISQDNALQHYVQPVPMGWPGQPSEFADLVVF
jgi:NAD(P)-dependent dehydrogenase (short-subunit alcohol dehydrogenase family)